MNQVVMEKRELPYAVKEELKLLRTNIQFCGADKRMILVTSAVSSEGKSTSAFNLCDSFAELGKSVILIDTDMRRSTMSHKVASGTVKAGLSHYLSGQCGIGDVIYETGIQNLHCVFSGNVPPNPVELLANDRMKALLDYAKNHYDYVIVDAAPLGMVVDAAAIAPQCDGAILLLESGKINYHLASNVAEQIKKTGCPLLGVVLNKVDYKSGKKYYKGYYKHYYKEYA